MNDPNHDPALYPLLVQQNLRNRVSYTGNIKFATDAHPQQQSATFYTYDIHGNVDILLQDYKGITEMESTGNRFKRITYDYDLISGKVNAVNYQPPFYNNNSWTVNKDAFYHKYRYDAENRLIEVKTSRDRIIWETDATYQYYKHGPLARTEYGQLRVQGIDYAYTLHGWLKGVNSTAISATSPDCPEGTVLGAILNVPDRALFSQPLIYKASQEINFEPGFESVFSDLFETEINPGATVCTPGSNNDNIPYTQGDMGRDGDPADPINSIVARDAFGFALNYYNNDYKAITTGLQTFATGMHDLPQATNDNMITGAELFNGNIASMLVNIPRLGIADNGNSGNNPILYGYRYDQLNRLIGMNAYKNNPANTQPNTFSPELMDDYRERISYDPNGNILTYDRNGTTAPPKAGTGTGGKDMDVLTYKYLYTKTDNTKGEYIPGTAPADLKSYTNQLASVQDAIGDANYTIDIDNQDAFNYEYDKIGNLVKDKKEGILNISWTVYGKISSITKDADKNQATTNDRTTIEYTYDAAGNRISKTVIPPSGSGTAKTTIYARDASGNTMSVYERETSGELKQTEVHLYGSSRIGMVTEQSKPWVTDNDLASAKISTFTRNEKIFELNNHLGNVLVTISDKRKAVDSDADSDIDYYDADVVSANDYYPFGMMMPGRKYNSGKYRYGFNGKENDNEVKGEGNSIDFGARVYDPRVGRFLSLDPFSQVFPGNSPYCYSANNPLLFIENNGEAPGLPPLFDAIIFMRNIGFAHPLTVWGFSKAKNTSLAHLQKAAWYNPMLPWDPKFHSVSTNWNTLYGVAGEIEMIERFYTEIAPNQFLKSPVRHFLKPENILKEVELVHQTVSVNFEPDKLTDYTITYTPKSGMENWNFIYAFDDIRENIFSGPSLWKQFKGEPFSGKTIFVHEVKVVSPDNEKLLDIIDKGVEQLLSNPLVRSGGIPVLVIDVKAAEKAIKLDKDRFSKAIKKLREFRGGLATENGLNSAASGRVNGVLKTIRTTTEAPPQDYYKNTESKQSTDDKENQ